MLVLTRKRDEMIQIGEDICIKVIRTGASTVKIGIDAPAHIRVMRSELLEDTQPADDDNTLDVRELYLSGPISHVA